MVDPENITDFHREYPQLQEFFLFCVFITGARKSSTQAEKLDRFLSESMFVHPFMYIEQLESKNILEYKLREHKVGQYTRTLASLRNILGRYVHHRLRDISVSDLEKIPGFGPKTSRFFILHSREGVSHAVLDKHILSWLKDIGHQNVPSEAPQRKEIYLQWEDVFRKECEARNMSMAELDLLVWKRYSRGEQNKILGENPGIF